MRMTQGSAPISDHRENFDSLPVILLGDWSEARTSNGGTSGAFMHAGVFFPPEFVPGLEARPLERETGVDWVPFQALPVGN